MKTEKEGIPQSDPLVHGTGGNPESAIGQTSRHFTRRDFFLTGGQLAAGAAAGTYLGSSIPLSAAPAQAGAATSAPGAEMPCGTIGKVKISRVLLGGNLIGGWMHSRDLAYVGSLFRAYVTEEKILQTFALAEQCGVNTVFETGGDYIKKYNDQNHRNLQFIPHIQVDVGQSEAALKDHIKAQVDTGAVALYVWGVSSDALVEEGKADLLLRVPCDFYVKTLHTDNYPSATPKERRVDFMWRHNDRSVFWDNMWCLSADDVIAFFKTVTKPWIAFKVLAAGAIHPREAFPFAFKNGADFIAVGMFDFQLKENCELAPKVIRRTQQRERPWINGF